MSTVHVVTGAGPVGSTVALQLADAGHPVRLLTRSGHPWLETSCGEGGGVVRAGRR